MGTSVSRAIQAHVRTFAAAAAAFTLTLGLAPMAAFADDSVAASSAQVDSVAGPLAGPGYEGDARSASADSSSEGPTLASTLAGSATSIVSADVALDAADPIVGSFTVGGLTYAVGTDGVTLVAVDASAVSDGAIAIPSSVTYDDTTYSVTAVGPYAFYLSGATDVALPASVASVDCCAFRSSDVARVEVDPDNSNLASFDGALYSADLLSLLLIPEGRAGAVLLPETAEVAEPSKFSHCSLVDAISVGEGGAAFASWDGLLYDASSMTLLRVPAGATDITIRDGCTTIAAGALEGCAKLERINAPASVTSISPDVFESVPTISLPAASLGEDVPQLSAMIALSAMDRLPLLCDASSVDVFVPFEDSLQPWAIIGFNTQVYPEVPAAASQSGQLSIAAVDHQRESLPVKAGSKGTADWFTSGGGTMLWITCRGGAAAIQCAYTDTNRPPWYGYRDTVKEVVLGTDGATGAAFDATSLAFWFADFSSLEAINLSNAGTGFLSSVGSAESMFQGCTNLKSSEGLSNLCEGLSTNAAATLRSTARMFAYCMSLDAFPEGMTFSSRSGTLSAYAMFWGANGITSIPGNLNISVSDLGAYPANFFYVAFDSTDQSLFAEFVRHGQHAAEPTVDVKGRLVTTYAPSIPNVDLITLNWGTMQRSLGSSKTVLTWNANGGMIGEAEASSVKTVQAYASSDAYAQTDRMVLPPSMNNVHPEPTRIGYDFKGWYDARENGSRVDESTLLPSNDTTYYAQWEPAEYDIVFDVDSEPGDVDYPGNPKDDQTANVEDGAIPIEDPKRPGYVFEGWVIPNGDGTEAVDQNLVYQGDDGKWYVDASKLPDYAGDDGRVELTARWTSVISVDVPSSVTFYADMVTKGQESREGAAEGAFGQSKVANQSQVDLRVVGLESSAVKTEGSTLGADSILKKADAATPSTSTQKLLSLYPSTKQWTADELQDPDAVGGNKATSAVDFDLDDVLLEKSFAADDFTIAAGGTLNMGYRLNLSETGQQLDYDKLSTLSEGQSASIANVSYCFATSHCLATGTTDDDIYIEYGGKVYGTADILHAANCISKLGEASPCYALYEQMMHDQGVPTNGYLPADAKAKVYAKYTSPEATASQPNCDRAGYVRLVILGVNHDVLELKAGYPDANGFAGDGSKDAANGESYVAKRAGLTFQFMDILEKGGINGSNTNSGGWEGASLRSSMNNAIIGKLAIKDVVKTTYRYRHNYGGVTTTAVWQKVLTTTQERLFIPSAVEMCARLDPATDSRYADNGGVLAWHNHEGYEYEYYKICGLSGTGGGALAKRDAQGRACSWWNCQPTQSFATYWYYVSESGGISYTNASSSLGIASVFCL